MFKHGIRSRMKRERRRRRLRLYGFINEQTKAPSLYIYTLTLFHRNSVPEESIDDGGTIFFNSV